MKINNFFQLLGLNFKVGMINCVEFFRIISRYYPCKRFRQVDIVLLLSYLFKSPFRISKKYLQKKGEEDVYQYGETPLTTLDEITTAFKISPDDVVYELGCGRGRTCFWLGAFFGCKKVVGVDIIPDFIDKAKKIQLYAGLQTPVFRCEDMLTTDLSEATVVYLYGSNYDDLFLSRLIHSLKQIQHPVKVISVSYPLFREHTKIVASFPWGEADVFLSEFKKGH